MGVGTNTGYQWRRGTEHEADDAGYKFRLAGTSRTCLEGAITMFVMGGERGSYVMDDEGFKICNLASKRGWQYTLVPLSVSELVWKWLRNQQPEGPISFIAETQTLNDGTPVLTITLDRA